MSRFFSINLHQMRLLPTDPTLWIDSDDLIFYILSIVDVLNLSGFYKQQSPSNWGGKGYDPKTLLTIILMGYSEGHRHTRDIEAFCKNDIRLRSYLGDLIPDHSTISRFLSQFSAEIEELFDQVVSYLIQEKVIDTSVIAVDGTKIKANASLESNKTHVSITKKVEQLKKQMSEYKSACQGLCNCDNTPNHSSYHKMEEKLERLELAKQKIEGQHYENVKEYELKKAERERIESETGKKIRGRKLSVISGDKVDPKLRCNTTDPESLIQKDRKGYLQGYNAQAAVSKNHYIIAADLVSDQNDLHQLSPMVKQITDSMMRNDINPISTVILADAGYCVYQEMPELFELGVDLYIPSKKEWKIEISTSNGLFTLDIGDIPITGLNMYPGKLAIYGEFVYREWMNENRECDNSEIIHDIMEAKITSPSGRDEYRARKYIVESIFGYIKEGMKYFSFLRRGIDKCKSEWKLICTCYNIKRAWKKSL